MKRDTIIDDMTWSESKSKYMLIDLSRSSVVVGRGPHTLNRYFHASLDVEAPGKTHANGINVYQNK